MKKVFFILLSKIRKLGCKIVFANFQKIFLSTGKQTLDEAETTVKFLVQSVKETQLFSYLDLQPAEYWRILLFKDLYNYGGVKESVPDKVYSQWNVRSHLPVITHRAFNTTMCDFILKVYKFNLRQRQAGTPQADIEDKKVQSLMDTVDDVRKEGDHDFISKLIVQYFS